MNQAIIGGMVGAFAPDLLDNTKFEVGTLPQPRVHLLMDEIRVEAGKAEDWAEVARANAARLQASVKCNADPAAKLKPNQEHRLFSKTIAAWRERRRAECLVSKALGSCWSVA